MEEASAVTRPNVRLAPAGGGTSPASHAVPACSDGRRNQRARPTIMTRRCHLDRPQLAGMQERTTGIQAADLDIVRGRRPLTSLCSRLRLRYPSSRRGFASLSAADTLSGSGQPHRRPARPPTANTSQYPA